MRCIREVNSVKDESFTRKFVPAAQSLQVMERIGYFHEISDN
jgi:hypothetical protein